MEETDEKEKKRERERDNGLNQQRPYVAFQLTLPRTSVAGLTDNNNARSLGHRAAPGGGCHCDLASTLPVCVALCVSVYTHTHTHAGCVSSAENIQLMSVTRDISNPHPPSSTSHPPTRWTTRAT